MRDQEMFSQDQVIAEARRRYGGPVCLDCLGEALEEETLQAAVDMILLNSVYWDSSTGNPTDPEIWARILP